MLTLTDIYETLKDCQVVNTQAEFSQFCGMRPSWYSSHVSRKRGIGLATLYTILWEVNFIRDTTIADMEVMEDDIELDAFEAGIEALDELMDRIKAEMKRRMS